MLSLGNVRSEEELRAWVERMRNHLAREGIEDPSFEFVVEPKIDGLAISLLYRDGVLRARRHARQRRDRRGRHAQPAHDRRDPAADRSDAPALLEVRGEVYMSLQDFPALNERRAEAGPVDVHEPAQLRRGHDPPARPAVAAQRPLSIWGYQVGVAEGLELRRRHCEALGWLREHGFRVNRDIKLLGGEEEVVAQCLEWQRAAASSTSRSTASSSRSTTSSCSAGSGRSVATRAGRWPGSSRRRPPMTRLEKVMWNVGKFGDLRPYAVLEPVRRRRRDGAAWRRCTTRRTSPARTSARARR